MDAPLLLASDGSMAPASSLRWPSSELQSLPLPLQRAVLEAAAAEGLPLLHPEVAMLLHAEALSSQPARQQQQQRHKQQQRGAGHGSGGGGGGGGSNSANSGNNGVALRKASLLLESVRRDVPASTCLPLSSLIHRFFGGQPPVPLVLSCTSHLLLTNQPQVTRPPPRRQCTAMPTSAVTLAAFHQLTSPPYVAAGE